MIEKVMMLIMNITGIEARIRIAWKRNLPNDPPSALEARARAARAVSQPVATSPAT